MEQGILVRWKIACNCPYTDFAYCSIQGVHPGKWHFHTLTCKVFHFPGRNIYHRESKRLLNEILPYA
jgi:hypothetical protein